MDPFSWTFGLLVTLVMGTNVLIWRHRLRKAEAQGVVRREDTDHFVRVIGVGLMAFAAVEALMFAAMGESPCPPAGSGDPRVFRMMVVQVVFGVAALAWALGFGGAELIARLSPGFGRRVPGTTWSPWAVKAALILFFVLTLGGGLMASMANPAGGLGADCVSAAR